MTEIRVNDDGNIQFRHPVNKKVVKRGVGKKSQTDQGKICDDLMTLLEAKPKLLSEAPKGLHDTALNIYFKPLSINTETDFSKLEASDIPDRDNSYVRDHMTQTQYAYNLSQLQVNELEAELRAMRKKLALQGIVEESVTLKECFEHFKKHTKSKSLRARNDMLKRVGKVVTAIGDNTKHGEITKSMIESAINNIQRTPKGKNSVPSGVGKTTQSYMLRDAKRFFLEISHPIHSDGLGVPNPAIAIKPGGIKRTNGDVEILDPVELLKSKKFPAYWKAFVAVLGYGGLRLSEAAALEWRGLASKEGIIYVRPTKFKPNLKNSISERTVKPFPDMWEHVAKYKKSAAHKTLVFDREGPRGPTWFEERDGQESAINLPGAFKDAIEDATGKKVAEPARRLRRFWETTMRAKGLGYLIEGSAGHSDAILADILSRQSNLPVKYAVDKIRFKAGVVYLAPADHHMQLGKTMIHLTRGPRENSHRPAVDVLFRSAAENFGDRTISVVLSGYLSDGAIGQWEVHRRGGLTIVQESADAEVPEMPENAGRYSPPDYVLPAAKIADTLAHMTNGRAGSQKVENPGSVAKVVATQKKSSEHRGQKAGQSSIYTCPECGGVLWELQHGGMVHYQCHVGHAYGVDDLISSHSEKVEQALWTALRALEENASLSRKVSTYMKARGHQATQREYELRAQQSEKSAAVLRSKMLAQPKSHRRDSSNKTANN